MVYTPPYPQIIFFFENFLSVQVSIETPKKMFTAVSY